MLLLAVAFALYWRLGTVSAEPLVVAAPVQGRWVPVNSPADKVPSHGLHAYGQTYAVDMVHVPAGEWRLDLGWSGPHTRPPQDYPGFGEPVFAPADGTVLRVRGSERDHGARTSLLGVALMVAEGGVKELTGRVLGNHIVLDLGSGTFAALAHLKRGSPIVRVGDRVRVGDQLAECGNSGNTSEPHVHFQLMDRASIYVAAGLPFRFSGIRTDGGDPVDLPKNGQAFVTE